MSTRKNINFVQKFGTCYAQNTISSVYVEVSTFILEKKFVFHAPNKKISLLQNFRFDTPEISEHESEKYVKFSSKIS